MCKVSVARRRIRGGVNAGWRRGKEINFLSQQFNTTLNIGRIIKLLSIKQSVRLMISLKILFKLVIAIS
ncbi:hypothetical protein EV200_101552 [Pedobacter psychrotolerans]|uniref:Uncharacterized protein n=1 Tax=Pedobacter psychrotolerans TaxID=1843235 RepID=A0A4R2HMR4_9SPHI|nr:hypothetical protein EV200_101552 [Pedobacter psychrotolerans]